MVLSIICRPSRDTAASAANIRPEMPRADQEVQQGRLADIGGAEDGDEAAARLGGEDEAWLIGPPSR